MDPEGGDGGARHERSVARFDAIMRVTRDAAWELDTVTGEYWVNDRMRELLEYHGPLEGLFEAWTALLHPDDRERMLAHNAALRDGQESPWENEYRLMFPDGRILYTLDRGMIERDHTGRAIRITGVMTDVTATRVAYLALRESEERLRLLSDTIDAVLWIVDLEPHRLVYVSSGFERLWGQPSLAVYERVEAFTDSIHPEDRERVLSALRRLQLDGYEQTYRVVRPDGRTIWIRDRGFPVRDPDGVVRRMLGIASDITALRRLEEELAQVQRMETIGRFAGGIAHDFNNMLTVIQASAQLGLRRAGLTGEVRADLEQIVEAGQRASELTSQLLAFARRKVIAPTTFDLDSLTRQLEPMLRRLIGSTIVLVTRHDAPGGIVLADRSQLEQVLVNLAVNARDAMEAGGRLTIETTKVVLDSERAASLRLEPRAYVMIAVTDTGSGIPTDVQPHVFEPFFTTKPSGQGTGLGLATCYSIVQQAGGAIVLRSDVGKGTRFELYIPHVNAA